MKCFLAAISIGILVSIVGCDRGTSGGPGASSPPSKADILGQADDTFSLTVPQTKLSQGESQTISVKIKRGENFDQDVSLKLADLPRGVTMDPASPTIKHGDTEATFALKAADDASLGDFTVALTGRPTLGAEAVSELKFTVTIPDSQVSENAVTEAVREKRNEYEIAAQNQLDVFAAKYAAMKERVAAADGQTRLDLDSKCVDAETKMETAASKLSLLKSASADLWDDCKEEVENAFEALKNVFV